MATTLPLTNRPTLSRGGAVPPFFAGLLPEGRRLTALRRAVKTSADDELSLLLAVGSDAVGDVSVLAGGTTPEEAEVADIGEAGVDFTATDFTDLLAGAGIVDPVAIPGVQDKVSGRMLTAPLVFGGGAHFLKVSPPEFPAVVENEAFFLGRATRLGLPVSAAEVVRDRRGRSGLLLTRFDRRPTADGRLERLALEDATQLLGRYPVDKYAVTTEEVAAAVARVCTSAPLALRTVFLQVVFAWATGNGDLHGKNLSVLRGDDGWEPSPVYDIPSTLPYGDVTMALPVGGRRDGFSGRAMLEFADRIGLAPRAAERALGVVGEAVAGLADGARDAGIPLDARRARDLERGLRKRQDMLFGSSTGLGS